MGIYKTYIEEVIKNPLFKWIKWYFTSRLYIFKHRNSHIRIKNMARVDNTVLGLYNTIYDHVELYNSSLGDFVYVAPRSRIANTNIGKFCSIGPDVKIGVGIHPTNLLSTFPAFFSTQNQCQISFTKKNIVQEYGVVNIGNDVWIGANVIILDNVTVGNGAIIGAGAVVTKDVDPYSIVAGIPAKKIKQRFDEKTTNKLQKIAWWEHDVAWIQQNIHMFTDTNFF